MTLTEGHGLLGLTEKNVILEMATRPLKTPIRNPLSLSRTNNVTLFILSEKMEFPRRTDRGGPRSASERISKWASERDEFFNLHEGYFRRFNSRPYRA